MLAALIPLFDTQLNVSAYCIFAQRGNSFLDTMQRGALLYDNVARVEGFELLNSVGINTLAVDRDIFVPINHISLFSDLVSQCPAPPERIVLLMDSKVFASRNNLDRIRELKKLGFRFAMQKIMLNKIGNYRNILLECDYILLNPRRMNVQKAKPLFGRIFPNLKLGAIRVDSPRDFEILSSYGSFDLYQGSFFRIPSDKSDEQLSPMKTTYLELLKVVNKDDYDLIEAADVISQDAALVLSLLSIVNRMTLNYGITSVRHAAAMLGQTELKRWINTVITKGLCEDKPSEVTRLAMLRARFAENISKCFGLKDRSDELFLMGLFSALDIMLDRPIDEALSGIRVSKDIHEALVYRGGDFAPCYEFILEYENAAWEDISRMMIIYSMDMDEVYSAYQEALQWFRDLMTVA